MKRSERFDGSRDPFEGDRTLTLQSVGAGVTFYPQSAVTLKLEFAVPVSNTIPSDGHNDGRFWASLIASF